MLVAADCRGRLERVVAERLDSDALHEQFCTGMAWVRDERDDVLQSKFSLELAWFRECWWEMVRRNLVTVN